MSYDAALQKHKGYCFIEYDCPEAATLALEQMRNTTLSGRVLKINRPNNVGPSLSMLDEAAAEAAKVRAGKGGWGKGRKALGPMTWVALPWCARLHSHALNNPSAASITASTSPPSTRTWPKMMSALCLRRLARLRTSSCRAALRWAAQRGKRQHGVPANGVPATGRPCADGALLFPPFTAQGKGGHRGYAWIDFGSEEAATEAVQSMNLFDLAGQFLRVCKGLRYDAEAVPCLCRALQNVGRRGWW